MLICCRHLHSWDENGSRFQDDLDNAHELPRGSVRAGAAHWFGVLKGQYMLCSLYETRRSGAFKLTETETEAVLESGGLIHVSKRLVLVHHMLQTSGVVIEQNVEIVEAIVLSICVIANIKDVLYTRAKTRSLNFTPTFPGLTLMIQKCTSTFSNKGVPLTRHRPILYRFIQVMIIHRRDPAPREHLSFRLGARMS